MSKLISMISAMVNKFSFNSLAIVPHPTRLQVALYLISTRYLIPTIYSTTSHSFLFTLIK